MKRIYILIAIGILASNLFADYTGFYLKVGVNQTFSKHDYSNLDPEIHKIKSVHNNPQCELNGQVPLLIRNLYTSVGIRFNYRDLNRRYKKPSWLDLEIKEESSIDFPVDLIYYFYKDVGLSGGVSYSIPRDAFFGKNHDPNVNNFWNIEIGVRYDCQFFLCEVRYSHAKSNLFKDSFDAELYYRQIMFILGANVTRKSKHY